MLFKLVQIKKFFFNSLISKFSQIGEINIATDKLKKLGF